MTDGKSDTPAKTTHRLTLHIPNSYPRATSPRGSPVGSPSSTLPTAIAVSTPVQIPEDSVLNEETVVHTHDTITAQSVVLETEVVEERAAPSDEEHSKDLSKKWTDYFRARTTSGESSRDFLARERTYFSWLRLACFLAIAAVALFLRLRLRIFPDADASGGQDDSVTTDLSRHFAKALARKALRKQLELAARQKDIQLGTEYSASSQLILSPFPDNDDDNDKNDGVLDSIPAFSKTLGIIFFILAVVAMFTGHLDYMRCTRALEEADKLITLDEDDPEYDPVARLHNARSAKQAHSNRLVHIVEIVIALAIFAVALIILITVNQGNIEPVPSL